MLFLHIHISVFYRNFALYLQPMSTIKIHIQETNNESILKFVSNTILVNGGSYEFNNIDEAKNSSLAQQLFYLPFVKKVLVTANFIAIQRFDIVQWSDVEEEVREQIENLKSERNEWREQAKRQTILLENQVEKTEKKTAGGFFGLFKRNQSPNS